MADSTLLGSEGERNRKQAEAQQMMQAHIDHVMARGARAYDAVDRVLRGVPMFSADAPEIQEEYPGGLKDKQLLYDLEAMQPYFSATEKEKKWMQSALDLIKSQK